MTNLLEQSPNQDKNLFIKKSVPFGIEKLLEKRKLKSSFLKQLKGVIKYTSGGIVALALTAHLAQKEYPDYISKEKEPTKIEWNESTQKEIKKLSHEYVLIIKTDPAYEKIPDSVFEKRFIDFVAAYGPDIKIAYTGDGSRIENKINKWSIKHVFNRTDRYAQYADGVIFLEEKNLKMKDDNSGYDFKTSNLVDFLAEISHHINYDYTVRRSIAYTENLILHDFNQKKMYKDPYSVEYQAHEITRSAISKYLAPEDHNLNTDFVDIYNAEHKNYREIFKLA